MTPVAVVDVGSNSLHLQVVADGETLASGRSAVKLGAFVDGALRPAAIDGALEALGAFREQADRLGATPLHVSGTAALREASNAQTLVDRALDELGIPIRVLSGEAEARLAWRGARHGLGFDRALVFDLGGRSTELCDGTWAVSLPLGHISATALGSPERVTERVHELLAPLDVPACPALVGCAGTALTLGRMAAAARGEQGLGRHARVASRDELAEMTRALQTGDPSALPGVDSRRVATLPLGAVAVLALMDALGFDRFTTSESALREGLIQEVLECSSH